MSDLAGFFYPRTATGRSSLLPEPPWHYSGDLLTVEYRTDPARVAELLPGPLQPAPEDPGAVALIWADWQSCGDAGDELLDPVRAQYRECFAVVRCAFEGQVYSRCVYIWVDADFALVRGLHQGYPKKLGSIHQTRAHPFGRAAPRIAPGGTFAGTLAAADRRLAQAVVTLRERAPSAGAFTDLSPIDEQPLAEVARGGEAEVATAVRAASDAFGGWSATPPKDRAAVLHAIADGIESRAAELAAVETADNGALLRSHVRSVMPRAAQNFRFFADWLGELDGGELEIRGHREEVSWAPSGVTAVITPWNAPLMLATWRIAPTLAAGNPVVAKPPEWAPLTASLLADITRDAGLPDGVFNVVQGLGEEAGAPLAAHPDLARVCFTGSAATGRLVAAAAGAQLTPVSLELGGKSPLIVFADADLDLAVRHAVGQYDNAGQVCLAGTRLLVEAPAAGEFLARFTERARMLRQGDPRDDTTDVGPNITREHLERVDGFVRRAVAAGARP